MKKYRLLVVLLRTNALARKPAQKLKLTHQSANRFRRPYQVDYIASLQAQSKRGIKQIHSPNRLTGRTGITRSRHLTVSLNIIAQIILDSVSLGLNSITARRYKDKVRSITANRAFRGMAGLAVLYPSVVDYIGWGLGTLSASCMGL